jgi:hypothetical protein
MHSRDSLNTLSGALRIAKFFCALTMAISTFNFGASAQSVAGTVPLNVEKPGPKPLADASWTSLSNPQRFALAPLEKSWDALSEGQRHKWLAIAKSYPDLGAPEQEKLHSRMAEWAALSPKDREVARLNFAHSKSVAKSDLTANWEAYQALSPDERKKLAQGAKVKPVGAAVAVTPVASEKLTPVPVTRRTPEQERAAAASQKPLNRNTLLPQSPALKSVTTADSVPLATPSKP